MGSPAALAEQRVLLLHSYAPDMEWVTTITAEVEKELLGDLTLESERIDLIREHMDTKRHYSPEYLVNFQHSLALKYSQTPFDLIIVSDNNAFDFILLHRDELFPGTPVVFCGVNGFDPKSLAGQSNITGIAEDYAPLETVELMLKLHPGTREIFVVNDFLTTGRTVQKSLESELEPLASKVKIRHNDNLPLPELLTEIGQLKDDQLLLIGVYFADSEGRHTTFNHIGRLLTAESSVPTYCLLDFNLGGGTVGGKVTGATIQGNAAGKLAHEVLQGRDIDSIPARPDGAFRWVFDNQAVERWQIDRASLPAGFEEINIPVTLFTQYRNQVLFAFGTLAFLLLVIIVLSANIRRRRLAELAVLEREEDLATTLQSIGDGVIATDHLGRITRLNPIAEQLLGWKVHEVFGQPLKEVFKLRPAATAPPGPDVNLSFDRVLTSGETVTIARGTILENRFGQEILIADSGAPIRSGDGKTRGVVIVFRDVTDQMSLESQLQHAQKMESVGQLAGGIAHDFNNMLTGIMGYAEILQAELQDNADQLESATCILQAGERASGLTRKLLDFSRKGKVLSTPLDMHDVICDSLTLLNRTLGQTTTILSSLAAKNTTLVGDPTQLQQAVMNLCINARDAMPDGGVIRIETSEVFKDQESCDKSPFELIPGHYLRLMVIDSGTGIPNEVKDRIFEPFFTTKEKGRGTGLGLAAVYGSIKDHHGSITVDSREGLGTSFTIDLPVQDVEVSASPVEERLTGQMLRGCVLVIDDDETVLGMAKELLTSVGYSVLTATDGSDGLLVFSDHREKIDVVLVDLVMPRLGGRHTFHGLKKMDPDVCVILTSGFAHRHTVEDLLAQGLSSFISKPYRRVDLIEAIENARKARQSRRGER